MTSRLRADDLTLRYDEILVAEALSVAIPDGCTTVIVGPNACGKSTLLKALGRLLRPAAGRVLLDGEVIHRLPTRQVAARLGLLPQGLVAPPGISVVDLVSQGRYSHRSWRRRWSSDNEDAVVRALAATHTLDLAGRPVDHLSGGQRQRVWIAMAIAQEAPIMLLDEPTTYLDVTHQLEILDILADLNQHDRRTVVMVLHDLNHAARYAHHLIVMAAGRVVAQGPPAEVLSESLLRDAFGLDARIVVDPLGGAPLVLPIGRHLNVSAAAPIDERQPRAPTP